MTFSLILLTILSLGGVSAFADKDENKNENEIELKQSIKVNDDLRVFEVSGEGKNRTEFRIKDNHDDEDSEFMIKGVISSASSASITIDGKIVNIDSSVTEEIKIVGKLEVGAYAMAKGIVKDSNLYAEKIVVNQRNKEDIEVDEDDDDEIASPSAIPTPTIEIDDDENATQSARQLDFGNIIIAIQNFLNYLREIASKI